MSMLSAQCDELREVAYKVDEYQMGRERVPLKTAAIMRETADTIWQLRDDLQRANAENAKLRRDVAETSLMLGGAWMHCTELREFAAETWELLTCNEPVFVWKGLREKARELGVEVG